MRTVTLFRHAKSSWTAAAPGAPPPADRLRPLADRGRRDAPRMAAWFAANGIRPDRVLCSSAVRTQQTFELVRDALEPAGHDAEIRDDLYLADYPHVLDVLRGLPETIHHVMLIGHDPGFHDAANHLVGAGDGPLRALLAAKFPTAGAAVIDFDCARWRSLGPGTGTLRHFMGPKRLPA
jgi:phosphohistidine phosphatase